MKLKEYQVNSKSYVYQTLYAKTLNIYAFYPSVQEFKKLWEHEVHKSRRELPWEN